MSRAVLYSPGYGAGWVSWHHGSKEERAFMLEYAPLIEAVRNPREGEASPESVQAAIAVVVEHYSTHDGWTREKAADAFGRGWDYEGIATRVVEAIPGFVRDWSAAFPGVDLPYLGGLRGLSIEEVGDGEDVRIEEYDGYESVETRGGMEDGWM